MIRKYCLLPQERVHLVHDINQLDLLQVHRGIVIVFAAWSGQAVMALQRLTRVLTTRSESLDFIVVDIESMTTQEMKQCFGREFHGRGETLWIRDGRVMACLESYSAEAEPELLVLNYTKQLLEEHAP